MLFPTAASPKGEADSFVEWEKGIAYLEADGSKALRWRRLSERKKTNETDAWRNSAATVAIADEQENK
jgi:hypothetical protein